MAWIDRQPDDRLRKEIVRFSAMIPGQGPSWIRQNKILLSNHEMGAYTEAYEPPYYAST